MTARLLQTVETIAPLRERIAAAAVQVAWFPALQKDVAVQQHLGTLPFAPWPGFEIVDVY